LDKHSASYDKQTGLFDRHLFGDSRAWACAQATWNTLEVAVGTGLNLPFCPGQARLTGIDFSPAMLAIARERAGKLGLRVELTGAGPATSARPSPGPLDAKCSPGPHSPGRAAP